MFSSKLSIIEIRGLLGDVRGRQEDLLIGEEEQSVEHQRLPFENKLVRFLLLHLTMMIL